MSAEQPKFNIQRLIAPVKKEDIDSARTCGICGDFIYPRLKEPLEVKKITEYRKRLFELTRELTETDGAKVSFGYYVTDEDFAHGFEGWGFTLKRENGKFEFVDGYRKWDVGEHIYEDPQFLRGGNPTSGNFDPEKKYPEALAIALFNEEAYRDNFDMEIELPDVLINLGWFGHHIGYLEYLEENLKDEQGEIKDFFQRENSSLRIYISGSEESVNKYLDLFEKRLDTAFISPRKA